MIFKIVHASDWDRTGSCYRGSDKDRADGFLHFSTAAQLPGTLAKHYAGATDALVLVAADCAALGDTLKFESSRDGALFPHLYGPLPLAAVKWVRPIERGEDGRFVLPGELS
ncbi:MAG TPA: DUF952 domain-containing protein [Rhizomicrobium sp.]|nr:DUF952 domain-containing protein [Rhizomicrobium sp.]